MSGKDAFKERERALEDQFFSNKEAELLQKLKSSSETKAALSKLSEETGVKDENLLNQLRSYGYDAGAMKLLHLVPILYVAWSDGKIDAAERETLLALAELRGVTPGTPLYDRVVARLETKPSEHEFEVALEAVSQMIAALPADKSDAAKSDIVSYSTSIASLSRKLLGLGPAIDAKERELLEKISKKLTSPRQTAANKLVGK